uniref:Alpha-amylase n=1 Tax=Saccoglossus kowalevskii TaxID=10224 RepID=A0ABM0N0J5_SACKO
ILIPLICLLCLTETGSNSTAVTKDKMTHSLFYVLLLTAGAYCQWDHHMKENRQSIVHLFEWKWSDVASECEKFFAPYWLGGVQVSPANEHRVVTEEQWRPWWERYQPVSYSMVSRSGDRAEFIDMVNRCNAVNINIYVDVVFNHMCGDGSNGYGIDGSWYDTTFNARDFPAVPYSEWDFNDDICDSDIQNYNDEWEVRNCRLSGLVDLKLSKTYVRDKVVEFLNDLISLGVAGFRVDACKHMYPEDLEVIYGQMNNLVTPTFPSGSRPFIVQEVIDYGGEAISATEYTHLGRVTEFKYGRELSNCFRGGNDLKYLYNWGEAWGLLPRGDALSFIDNHDTQRNHGGGGNPLTYKEPREYKMAVSFMLAHDYGVPRIMSSYYFTDGEAGPPSHPDGSTKDVTCFDEWVCEHRWRQITGSSWFRKVTHGTGVDNWWDNNSNQIAFSRGNLGWYAVNNDAYAMDATIYTGLPAGTYCNLYVSSYDKDTKACVDKENVGTPSTVTVKSNGDASVYISNNSNPVIVIHVDATV